MKILLSAFCLLCAGPAIAAPAPGVFPYKYEQRTLGNGLKVIVIPMDSPGVVAYWSIVRTGSRDEVEAGKTGFAHFFEHMMFRGTKRHPGPVYDRIVTGLGADANAFTTDDLTAYHLKFSKDDLTTVFDIESDRFQNLRYDEAAFQTEAGAVYGEYRKSVTQPFFLLEEKLRQTAFDRHTYKHTTMGFEADVKAMPKGFEFSLAFYDRFYRPENVVLLIVGDVRPDAVFALAEKHYAGWTKGYVAPKIDSEPPQRGERTAEVRYPGQTLPILDVAYKGDAADPDNPDFTAAMVLADLAFGKTSDLVKQLVLREQKTEFLVGSVPMNRDAMLYEIVAMVKKADDIPYVRDEIFRTIQRFQTTPVDAAKLDDVKRHNKYAFLMGLDSPERVAEATSRFIALSGGLEMVDRIYGALDRVTPDDVLRAAKKYFRAERRTVVVLKGAP